MSSITRTTVEEWVGLVSSGEAMGEALGLTPCGVLHVMFPAIVGDDDAMGALADMVDQTVPLLAHLEHIGAVGEGDAAVLAHDLFHLLQIAAGLGHMIGVQDVMAMTASDIPDVDNADVFLSLFGSLEDDGEDDKGED